MSDATDFADCRNCLCLEARRTAQHLTRAYERRLRPHGLTINQFSLLSSLILGGPQPLAALADRLGVERTTLVRNIAVAEKDGLVVTRQETSGRRQLVDITQQGRARAAEALPAWRMAQSEARDG